MTRQSVGTAWHTTGKNDSVQNYKKSKIIVEATLACPAQILSDSLDTSFGRFPKQKQRNYINGFPGQPCWFSVL
jgi:hypothetical protein